MKKYTVSDEQKSVFAGVYLLEYMINRPQTFNVYLDRDDQDLEPVLEWLASKSYINIQSTPPPPEKKEGFFSFLKKNKEDSSSELPSQYYQVSTKGRKVLQSFLKRYSDFLNLFDIFCAVDLEQGEFAFSKFTPSQPELAWNTFLNDERFDDLRVAVCDYIGINPVEIVFMSFIQEERFGQNTDKWQFDLLLGTVWDDILTICNTAIQWNELAYSTNAAKDVIQDIISQGADLIESLHNDANYSDTLSTPRQGEEPLPPPSLNYKTKLLQSAPFWDENWLL
jgi:hypothetical protein